MANLEDLENHVGTFRNGHVPDKSQTVDTKTALLGQTKNLSKTAFLCLEL